MSDILASYNTEKIIKEMLPEVLSKRELTGKTISKSAWQLLLTLFSMPILIPLAVVYLSVIITFGALAISGVVISFSGVIAFIPYIIEVIRFSNNFGTIIGLIGVGLLSFVIMIVFGYIVLKVMYELLKLLIKGFSSLVVRKRARTWKHLKL